jgi:DNA-binding transcriptional LysR family regulator
MMMELSQLRMFKAVADLGSIARAAQAVHCVPSNITARIKALECELGALLFYRDGRRLRISPAGEHFLGYAGRILALTDEATHALNPLSAPAGPLKIGAIESSATTRLPVLLARYHANFQQVSLQLSTGTWSQLVEDVAHHRLDGAIVAVDVEQPHIEKMVIYKEDLVLIASTSAGKLQSVADLVGTTFFMWPDGCPYRAALETWFARHHLDSPIVSFASYGTIVGCISAGAGISLVPKGIFETYGATAGLQAIEFPDLNAIENYFVWHRDSGPHPARDAFINLLKNEFSAVK